MNRINDFFQFQSSFHSSSTSTRRAQSAFIHTPFPNRLIYNHLIKLSRLNIHRCLPPLLHFQPRMHNPLIAPPIRMQINPKQRAPGPGLKRDSALLIPSPPPPFLIPRFNARKPRLPTRQTLLARQSIKLPPSYVLIPCLHDLGIVVPVMMNIEFLAWSVLNELRDAEIICW